MGGGGGGANRFCKNMDYVKIWHVSWWVEINMHPLSLLQREKIREGETQTLKRNGS